MAKYPRSLFVRQVAGLVVGTVRWSVTPLVGGAQVLPVFSFSLVRGGALAILEESGYECVKRSTEDKRDSVIIFHFISSMLDIYACP